MKIDSSTVLGTKTDLPVFQRPSFLGVELPDALTRVFLRGISSCEWRNILIMGFPADPRTLEPLLPAGIQLDLWKGRAWVSLVGLTLKNTLSFGVPIPSQRDYQQVGLRFYVKRTMPDGSVRRGVVFLDEWVPKPFLAFTARWFLNEKCRNAPVERRLDAGHHGIGVRYSWRTGRAWQHLRAQTLEWVPATFPAGGAEDFFMQRPWSYTAQRDGSVVEARLRHPRWRVYPLKDFSADLDSGLRSKHGGLLDVSPSFAFLAEGSEVRVCGFSRRIVDVEASNDSSMAKDHTRPLLSVVAPWHAKCTSSL